MCYRYSFCGPGTKLKKRLARGDQGINGLDKACKDHDIAYSKDNNLGERHKADKVLEYKAWDRVKAKDSSIGEKTAAWIVTNAMKVKRKLGMGLKRRIGRKNNKKKKPFKAAIIEPLKKQLINNNNNNGDFKSALRAAKTIVKAAGGRKKIKVPRVIPLPKTGGFLPLIPLFAGIGALGSLAGGAAGVAKAVNDAKYARKQLEEAERHNKEMEAITVGKEGSGVYLKPYRRGLGLFLNEKNPKNYQ